MPIIDKLLRRQHDDSFKGRVKKDRRGNAARYTIHSIYSAATLYCGLRDRGELRSPGIYVAPPAIWEIPESAQS